MSASSTRIARLEKVGAVMEDELVKQVLEKMGNLPERATNIEKNMLRKDLVQIKDLFKSIERGYDLVFGAGVLTEEGSSAPIEASVQYAQGAAPEARYFKLGRATNSLTKASNKIGIFLNTNCDFNNPCERMVDSGGDFEGDASFLHAWLCNKSNNDEDDTDIEDFVEEVIEYIKMALKRINNSNKLAYAAYGARPKGVNMSSHSLNNNTAVISSSYFGNNEQSKEVSDLASGKLKETKIVAQNQVQLKQSNTLS